MVGPRPNEYRMRTKNGRYRWGKASSLPVRTDGEITGIQGVITDITERKLAVEALQSNEKKYRTILESIGDGYFEVDIAGNFTFLNNSFCKMFGYPEEELIGKSYKNFMDEETGDKIYGAFNRVYRTGHPDKGISSEIIKKDGRRVHTEASVSLIRDPEGRRIGLRGITRDVTERKSAENERVRPRRTTPPRAENGGNRDTGGRCGSRNQQSQ